MEAPLRYLINIIKPSRERCFLFFHCVDEHLSFFLLLSFNIGRKRDILCCCMLEFLYVVHTQALPFQLKFTGLPSKEFVQRDKNKEICKERKYEFQKGILKISLRKRLFLTTSNRLGSVFRVYYMCVLR